MRVRSAIARKRKKSQWRLAEILARLDSGDIDVEQAHKEMQEYDRKHSSRLDRILEAMAS